MRTAHTAITAKLEEVADLLLLAEEASPELGRLTRYLIGRDPLTGPLLVELYGLARDAGIRIGSQHWSLSAPVINQQGAYAATSRAID